MQASTTPNRRMHTFTKTFINILELIQKIRTDYMGNPKTAENSKNYWTTLTNWLSNYTPHRKNLLVTVQSPTTASGSNSSQDSSSSSRPSSQGSQPVVQ